MSKYEPEQVDEMRAHRDSVIRIHYNDSGMNRSPVDITKEGIVAYPQDYPKSAGYRMLNEDQVNIFMSSKYFDREVFEMLVQALGLCASDALMVSLS